LTVPVDPSAPEGLAVPAVAAAPDAAALKACCASAYADPAVRWLLGGELHPGGAATTRRALELARLRHGDRLLDVACGTGASALLAAREHGARVLGIEYEQGTVRAATHAARSAGLAGRVRFMSGDAEALPVPDASVDVVLCECALCTFPDKARAAAEMRRVLAPGGRIALSDVVVDGAPLPEPLTGALATIACIGDARSPDGYRELLEQTGLRVTHVEDARDAVDRFTERIEERLRGARILGIAPPAGAPLDIEAAITAVRQARAAIASGALGYTLLIAATPDAEAVQRSGSPASKDCPDRSNPAPAHRPRRGSGRAGALRPEGPPQAG
jgi:arsenite methyltransferase